MKHKPITLYDIEDLHAAMFVRYANEWVRKWEYVPDTPERTGLETVRLDWLEALQSFSQEALWYGLKNLPPRVPNAIEFAAICKGFYSQPATPTAPKLAGPKPKFDPVKWAELRARVLEMFQGSRMTLAWAYELQARKARGEVLTEAQIEAMKRAFSEKAIEPTKMPTGHFKGIDERALPFAMCSKAEQMRRQTEGRAES